MLPIVNIVPGDFSGDSVIDMFVVSQDSKGLLRISLFLGNKRAANENDLGIYNST